MAIIKGQNLRMLISEKIVACATSCTIHVAANVEDVSTKDDKGLWQTNEASSLSWDGQADALVAVVSSAAHDFVSLTDLIGKQVTVSFVQTNLPDNEKNDLMSGNAIINDISLTAGNRQNATYSVKFTGTGELTTSGILSEM